VTVSRRGFVRLGAAAGAGLTLVVSIPGCGRPRGGSTFAPSLALRIGTDGTITVTAPRPDMGQGVRTSLPMLVAEELDVDLASVRIEQADFDDRFEALGGQYVGGSNSVRTAWLPLRRAGAAAREMLRQAAAERWGVPVAETVAELGRVRHPPSRRSLGYGELAEDAARLPVPEDPPLKNASELRLIGTPVAQLDAPDIATGRAVFGIDVRVPGMLYAAIAHAPRPGAEVAAIDASTAGVPGDRVIRIDATRLPDFPPNSPKPPSGVAVLAESTWEALRARDLLAVEWRGGADDSTEAFWRSCEARADEPPERVLRDDGRLEDAFAGAARTLRAVYRVPFLAHVPMEPMTATALVEDGRCEIWAPTQNPEAAREVAAIVTGLALDRIAVHPLRMGGAFGRRYYSDFVAQAVYLAREAGRPVKVVWDRTDDVRHGFYRPAGYHRMIGALDGGGRLVGWGHHLVNASRYASLLRDAPAGAGELYETDFPAAHVPHFRLSYTSVSSAIPRGQWRAIASSANVFVVESFLDELADAAGIDPVRFRLEMLRDPGAIARGAQAGVSERLARVIETVADRSGWNDPPAAGRHRGIAASYANGAFVAHVAEVGVDSAGAMRVVRVTSAVDTGTVVNPSGARAQVEGSVIMGLSACLHERVTVTDGTVDQTNFHDYPILRFDEAPAVDVHLLDSPDPPSGIGEGALPPLAPAVTNAMFRATGRRVRELPIGGRPQQPVGSTSM